MTFLMEKDLHEHSVKVKVTAQDFYAAFFTPALCNAGCPEGLAGCV